MADRVRVQDYDENVHKLHVLFRMIGVGVDYPVVDLMHRGMTKAKELGEDKFSIMDASIIQVEHEKYWEEYFKNLNASDEVEE